MFSASRTLCWHQALLLVSIMLISSQTSWLTFTQVRRTYNCLYQSVKHDAGRLHVCFVSQQRLSMCLSACLRVCPCICVPACLSLSICLPACLPLFLSGCVEECVPSVVHVTKPCCICRSACHAMECLHLQSCWYVLPMYMTTCETPGKLHIYFIMSLTALFRFL